MYVFCAYLWKQYECSFGFNSMRIVDQLQQLLSRGSAGNQTQLVNALADIEMISTFVMR